MKLFRRRSFRRESLKGAASAWTYLLRVTSRGFFGELSLGIQNVGKRLGRRLRLAARMFVPPLAVHKKWKPAKKLASKPLRSRLPSIPGRSSPSSRRSSPPPP